MPEPAVARPQVSAADVASERSFEVSPDRDERRIRKRRLPLTALFLGLTLLAAAVIGIWWGVQTGVFKTAAQLDTTPPVAPATVEGEDFTPGDGAAAPLKPGEVDQSRAWITVFRRAIRPRSIRLPTPGPK
jgi:hypothetical protein